MNEFAVNPVTLTAPDSKYFSSDGILITSPLDLLTDCGAAAALTHKLPLLQSGVQSARPGAIQDPAGSAVGQPTPTGGGASGAIYKAFPDLEGIPSIAPRSAIFNSSSGHGKRVLHSYSPQLSGSPTDAQARRKALEDIANTYCNAILAFNAQAGHPGGDGQLLNLVPVSAGIYAGQFKNMNLNVPKGHLDPSYNIVAIYIAIAALEKRGDPIPDLRLCYYEADVYAQAESFLDALALK